MQGATGNQPTALLKMTIPGRLPGCMPICIAGKGTTETQAIGMRGPAALQLAALSNQSGKKSSERFYAEAG